MDKDYKNYDYLYATVKRNKLNELVSHYKTLRWEIYETGDDAIYDDVVHLSLVRPHKIEHKDELQVLQIYLESAWNAIGRAENNPRPKTLITGLSTGIFAVIAIILGICLLIEAHIILGSSLIVAGVLLGVAGTVFCVFLYKKEGVTADKTIMTAAAEIAAVNAKAVRLFEEETLTGEENAR